MIGKTLGHYEILRSLGRGGMGEVFLARDTQLGREVALKLLPADLAADAGRRARFKREAQVVASLNHPHVVTVHAVDEVDDRPFLVMEFVDGQTLEDIIADEGLPLGRFFDLSLALTEAVAEAHGRGITHRDLKPRNVMIDRQGRLKVLDFGLAKLLEEPSEPEGDQTVAADLGATREGTIVGTAAYMSPEQAEGKPVDNRSDVFSLGILMYQMITGRKPFQGDTHMSTLTAVLRDEPRPVIEIRPELPRQLARIVRRCLEKQPDRRYESARGLHDDLRVLREEMDSGEHERPRAIAAAPKPQLRRLIPWVALGMFVLLAAAGGVWMAMSPDQSPPADVASARPFIAVFPFENLGPPEDAYFAAGVTDEIITSLTGVDGLRVLSRTSSQQYDRTGKTMQQIAQDLGVDYVLMGSVRWQRGGDGASQVRVTPQLVSATTDEQLWAARYDRAMEEIFAMQSEIATEVVTNLGVTLAIGAEPTRVDAPTDDLVAYHAYLRAREQLLLSRFDATSWLLAVDLLEKAVARDPSFHIAWVQLAKANAGLCHFNWDRTEDRLARSRRAVDRAVALAPDAAESSYAEGIYYYWGLKDYERALEHFRVASQRNPEDTDTIESMAYVLRRQERYEDAAEMLLGLTDRMPLSAPLAVHLGETLGIIGRYDEALMWAERAMQYGPDEATNYTLGTWVAVQAGRLDLARQYMDSAPPSVDAEVAHYFFAVAMELRDEQEALARADGIDAVLSAQYRTSSRDLFRGMALQAFGKPEQAREAFARAEAELASEVARNPEAGNVVAAHGVALAGLGRHDEAEAVVRRSLDLFPASKDPWILTWRLWDLAYIKILAGEHADAVAILADLMGRQTDIVSPAILRSSPFLDPLRGREDFRALLARHA